MLNVLRWVLALGMTLTTATSTVGETNVESGDARAGLPELQVRGGLPNFHVRASTGGVVRVAYLGGSITAGRGWRVRTREFLQQRYPQAEIEEIFAAIPGTGSSLGVVRLQRDVLDHAPDLLLVEFAVNDRAEEVARIEKAMEGIVRKLRQARPEADVCFVYTLSKNMVPDYEAGRLSPPAVAMERVAEHYGIPSVAFGVEVVKQLATGRWVFQSEKEFGTHDPEGRTIFSNDGVHPLAAGQALYAEAIERSWEKLVHGGDRGSRELPAPLHPDHWAKAGYAPVATMVCIGEWRELPADDARVASQPGRIAPPTWWSVTPGSAVEATVLGTAVGLYGFKSEKSGKLRVMVDDLPPVEATLRDTFSVPGHYRLKAWFYPKPLAPGPHRVRVELLAPDEKGRGELFLCGVLYSGKVK
jgi:lysophospholipase L1-like esterase